MGEGNNWTALRLVAPHVYVIGTVQKYLTAKLSRSMVDFKDSTQALY